MTILLQEVQEGIERVLVATFIIEFDSHSLSRPYLFPHVDITPEDPHANAAPTMMSLVCMIGPP
jgi:hypothetical protein